MTMSKIVLTLVVALSAAVVSSAAMAVGGETTNRRRFLASSSIGLSGLTGAASRSSAGVFASDPTVFLGTYTDPLNHPGGFRSIALDGIGLAGYQLATVKGGGGVGEPATYSLPAMIFQCPGNQPGGGKWCITIDFTPKGGPKDFQGFWDDQKQGIRFVLDNNFWPKQ
jgi:hypothetical protein